MKYIFEEFVGRTIEELKPDLSFTGLAVSVSWVRDEIDEFSDLDLILVYKDEACPRNFLEMRSVAETLGALVSSFTGEHVGDPMLLICLYTNPLTHVDLKFGAHTEFRLRSRDPNVA